MHFSALILALLSATTLAAPLDANAPSSTQPHPARRSASSKKPRLGALLVSWPDNSCGGKHPGSADGVATEVVEAHCVPITDQQQFFHVTLNYGVLEVFKKADCKGTVEQEVKSKKWGIEICLDTGETIWASAKVSVPAGTEWAPPR